MVRILIVWPVLTGLLFSAWFSVEGYAQSQPDTIYQAIDLSYVTVPPSPERSGFDGEISAQPMGIGPSPFIVWHNPSTGIYGGMILTLDATTGAQRGQRLIVPLPGGVTPVDGIWGNQFSSATKSLGIEPSPWIVCTDFTLFTFPVTFSPDGTPVAGMLQTITPFGNPGVNGNATCMTEIPGSEFLDGLPRLFVGTDQGKIVVLVKPVGAGITVGGVISGLGAGVFTDVEPIPQYGYIALGALKVNKIYGIHYVPGSPVTVFSIVDSRTEATTHFDTFGDDGTPLTDPAGTVRLILANGTNTLALTTLGASMSGQYYPELTPELVRADVKSVVAGSLLMLRTDESAVDCDIDFATDSGFSGCEVTLTDAVADICGYVCGDANGDRRVNVGDAVMLINRVFKSGPAPNPPEAGDANCDSGLNVADAVYTINHVFKSGPKPCCP